MTHCVQQDVFVSGEGGYHTYRIPALLVSAQGTLLAFCEGRRHSSHDYGEIDLLVRRSVDGGATFGPTQVIASRPGLTCGNPAPVVDETNGTIWLLFCQNLADGPEAMIIAGEAPRTVWVTCSQDDGASWAEPHEITAAVKPSDWTWYATGPGHALQLSGGRLLVPCDHVLGVHRDRQGIYRSHVIYSDDHGETWSIGGLAPHERVNECMALETRDGRVYLNCRSIGPARRSSTWSADRGLSFGPVTVEAALPEPGAWGCEASVLYLPAVAGGAGTALFANPADAERRIRLGVRVSHDECATWSEPRTLWAGPAAYSDLAALPDGTVGCLYERGEAGPYERISLARFDLAWLERN